MQADAIELVNLSAVSILELLQAGEISPLDLLDALEARVAAVDGQVNALPVRCFERARARARRLMARPREERGLLSGLPVPIKDLTDVEGLVTSQGCLAFADDIARESDLLVERIEAEGGLVYAKSNTPEFGAGANTFNDVYGMTRNPWSLAMSAAGSSGGAAAALATGMAWVAHGSDMGGSLRSPASFCGVVGLRPSPGRVAAGPSSDPYQDLTVEGPMARNVADVALLLDAMTGWHALDPLALPRETPTFSSYAARPMLPRKVAFSPDLGIVPVDPEVAAICVGAALAFESLGVPVEIAHPDFSGVEQVFQTLRAFDFAVSLEPLLEKHRRLFKPEVVWNIERGLELTVSDVGRARRERAAIRTRALQFFADYDLLLTPATIVPPYPVEQRYVESCAGHRFETYVDWLAIASAITVVSLPALSLPCGFTQGGLPVGLQMVGRPRGEGPLLAVAAMLEQALGLDLTPIDPRPASTAP